MLRAYLLVILGSIVGPALVVGTLWIVIDGRVPDFSNPSDVASHLIALVGGAILWGIGASAFRRMMRGEEAESKVLGVIAKAQPLMWLIGIGFGVFAGSGIVDSALGNRARLAASICDHFESLSATQTAACLEIALSCYDEAKTGVCGEIASQQAADACMSEHKRRLAALTGTQRAQVPEVDGDYEDSMRTICIAAKIIP